MIIWPGDLFVREKSGNFEYFPVSTLSVLRFDFWQAKEAEDTRGKKSFQRKTAKATEEGEFLPLELYYFVHH